MKLVDLTSSNSVSSDSYSEDLNKSNSSLKPLSGKTKTIFSNKKASQFLTTIGEEDLKPERQTKPAGPVNWKQTGVYQDLNPGELTFTQPCFGY